MLLKVSDYMQEAERHAAECGRNASKISEPFIQSEWIVLESRWQQLREAYAFLASAQRFMEDGARMTQQRLEKAGLDGTILLAPPDQPA